MTYLIRFNLENQPSITNKPSKICVTIYNSLSHKHNKLIPLPEDTDVITVYTHAFLTTINRTGANDDIQIIASRSCNVKPTLDSGDTI